MKAAAAAESNASAPYERITAWQACHALVLAVYEATATWPRDELVGLTAQCRRACVSSASNIVEGLARRGSVELARFLDLSIGSLAEARYLLQLSRDLKHTTAERWGELEALRDHAARLTWGLYESVQRRTHRASTQRKSPRKSAGG